jgi:hypothetical protein
VAEHRVRIVAWTAFVTFPRAGLSILLAAPHADVSLGEPSSHFWLVLGTSIATAILAYATGEVAARRGDGRLFLVSLGFPGRGGLPRAARARDAQGAARRAQRGLRPRHAPWGCWCGGPSRP